MSGAATTLDPWSEPEAKRSMHMIGNRKSALSMTLLLLGGLTGLQAAAAENPMERVGIENDQYLACLTKEKSTASQSQLIRVVEVCGYKPGTTTEDFERTFAAFFWSDPQLSVSTRLAVAHSGYYSSYEFSFFERLDATLAEAPDAASAGAAFAELEQEAIAKLDASKESSQSVLAALSVARHSLRYWTSRPAPPSTPGGMSAWKKQTLIVGSDIYGGLTGEGAVAAATSVGAYNVVSGL
jgi:hypothetical protein